MWRNKTEAGKTGSQRHAEKQNRRNGRRGDARIVANKDQFKFCCTFSAVKKLLNSRPAPHSAGGILPGG
jgi:hypothetical protein